MDGRSHSHDVLEQFRYAAIEMHERNIPVIDIAAAFHVSQQAVYRWIRKYKKQGKESLKSKKAPGPDTRLTNTQVKQLLSFLRKPASALGYSTDLWSGPRVRHLIKREFGIEFHPKYMPSLMRSLGFELKFPERRALEQDPKSLKDWKNKRFPELLKTVKKKKGLLFYADESMISLIPYVGKTWALPGQKVIAKVSGKQRQNIGITAAVNQQGRLCFELLKKNETFTAKIFVRFLKKLIKQFSGRYIVLIVDGAPVHKAKIIKAFTETNKSRIQIEILPAYSPELNPTEKCWRHLKTKKLNGSMATSKDDLRDQTKKHMNDIKKNKKLMESFFDNI